MGLLDDAYAKARAVAGLLSDAYQTGAQAYFPNEEDAKARPEIAKGLLQFVPGPGDAISGYEAAQSARQGNYGEAALNGVGLLPFIPAMGGMIKEVGKMPKRGIYPTGITSEMISGSPSDMFGTGMSGSIKQLTNGDYLGRYMPAWMGEGKPFYAIGDNAEELKQFMLRRMGASEAGTTGSKTAKFNKSLVGQLQKLGFPADDFRAAHSTQSSSEYLTHSPTGVKIRISDHDLPLHYEQPDVDLRSWMSDEEKIALVKKAIEQ